MSGAQITLRSGVTSPWLRWLPVLAGLLVLYVPTYADLSRTFWPTSQGTHGPVMLALTLWAIWRERAALLPASEDSLRPVGRVLLGVGLLMYVLGRSQEFRQMEVGSQVPVLLGIVCLMTGATGLRRLWFPIVLLLFTVPMPGSLLDQMLLPLKTAVSSIVDELLHRAGYPIARSGVLLTIGNYNLLIADACSGLNSMVALSGVGLLYVYLAGQRNRMTNLCLLLSVLPIAFIANVIRVLILVLITYYAGEAAGERFHDHAGYLEILLAFGGFFAVDRLLSTAAAARAVHP